MRINLYRLMLMTTLLMICHVSITAQTPTLPTVIGYNWELPSWVTPSINSGFYGRPYDLPNNELPQAVSVELPWSALNPADDVYDWSLLEQAFTLLDEAGAGMFLRIYMSDKVHVPTWISEKYPTLTPMYFGANSDESTYGENIYGISEGLFYPIWDSGFESEIKDFLEAFQAQGFPANPTLIMMYAPGAWRWNEYEVHFVEALIEDGWTPQSFLEWNIAHLRLWANTFGEHVEKLVYTGPAHIDKTGFNPLWASVMNDLTTGNNRLTDEAVNLGMSVRTGALEEFNRYSDLPSWGAPAIEVNGYYYQQIDFAHPLRANLTRILATENEAWGNPDMTGFVSAYYDTNYVVRLNMLKALQLQLNWVNFSLNTYEVNPPLMDYVRLTLGKTATDSPDAWVLLREWRDMEYFLAGLQEAESYADLRLFRNWERWLYQRDIAPNGMTIGVDNTISPLLIGIENDAYDYTASESRRTDHANGSDYIYFAIDDNFLKDSDQSVQILVTYLDNFVGTWWVEYDAGVDRVFHATPAQVMVNDMQWKTVTFAISDGSFGNRQTGDMDFRLYNGGEHDLTVQFVRIIKE